MNSPLVSALACTAALAWAGSAWGQAVAPPGEAEIAQAATKLGDPKYAVREQATEDLWRAGNAAQQELRQALKSPDPEVRTRAAAVLHRLRLGVTPQTPADALVLIDQFLYSNSPQARQQALAELQSKVDLRLLFNLIRGESGKSDGPMLSALVAAETGKLLRPLLEQNRLDEAQELLELLAASDQGLAQLAAFLLITGRLDEQIEEERSRHNDDPRGEHARRLACFLRAKGEPSAAADVATTQDALQRAKLLAVAQRWNEAAVLATDLFTQDPSRLDAAAVAAAYHRLAGNDKRYEEQIALLTKRVEENAGQGEKPNALDPDARAAPSMLAWTLIETLLINEEPSRALELLKKINPAFAHAILWRQHRHAEALSLCNVAPGKPLDQAWLASLPVGESLDGTQRAKLPMQFPLAVQVARQLKELGEHEQVDEVLKTLRVAPALLGDQANYWIVIAHADWQLAKYDDLGRDAAGALATGASPAALFSRIVKQHGSLAASWYTILLDRNPGMDRAKAVEQALWMVVAQPPPGRLPDNWRNLVDEAYAKATLPSAQSKRVRLLMLAETCLIRGDRDLARRFFGEVAETDSAAAMKLGDLEAAAGDWAPAAAWYEKAAAASSGNPLPIYLHGHAMAKSGQAEAGAARMKLASLLVLAAETRQALAAGLQERGLKAEAAEQFDIVSRIAAPDSTVAVNSAQQAGNLVSAEHPERAADCWQQLLLHVLSPGTNFTEVEGYLNLPHLVHRLRARAFLQQNKPELAVAELGKAARTLPSDVRVIVEFVPKLDRAAQSAAADKLFEQAFAEHERVCREFPQSATYCNNAAWLAARSRRKLDEALALVNKAIELAPSEAAYHDTLAEVHFQRGDRDAAVAAARKALELSAQSKLFAARLSHFENDELKTLDGTEAEAN